MGIYSPISRYFGVDYVKFIPIYPKVSKKESLRRLSFFFYFAKFTRPFIENNGILYKGEINYDDYCISRSDRYDWRYCN